MHPSLCNSSYLSSPAPAQPPQAQSIIQKRQAAAVTAGAVKKFRTETRYRLDARSVAYAELQLPNG